MWPSLESGSRRVGAWRVSKGNLISLLHCGSSRGKLKGSVSESRPCQQAAVCIQGVWKLLRHALDGQRPPAKREVQTCIEFKMLQLPLAMLLQSAVRLQDRELSKRPHAGRYPRCPATCLSTRAQGHRTILLPYAWLGRSVRLGHLRVFSHGPLDKPGLLMLIAILLLLPVLCHLGFQSRIVTTRAHGSVTTSRCPSI